MAKSFTILDFQTRFPSDDVCLDHLMRVRFGEALNCLNPKCGKHGRFHRVKKRPLYECAWCGFQVSPMARTPFERTHTPLAKWFYAMYLFTTSRHGVPAKELQRQLGVTYKTAWRMGHEIRKYMGDVDGDPMLGGHVEADETYVGGKPRFRRKGQGGGNANYRTKKTTVFGMVERGGNVMTRVVPNAQRDTLVPEIVQNVCIGSIISTDEWHPYKSLPGEGYGHLIVKHKQGQYVDGIAHTNTLDGFWSMLKRAIRGTHVHVSRKHMSKYLGEFEYRYNMRKQPEQMFNRLLASF